MQAMVAFFGALHRFRWLHHDLGAAIYRTLEFDFGHGINTDAVRSARDADMAALQLELASTKAELASTKAELASTKAAELIRAQIILMQTSPIS